MIPNFLCESYIYKQCTILWRELLGKEVSGEGGTEAGVQKVKLTKIHYTNVCHCQTKKKN